MKRRRFRWIAFLSVSAVLLAAVAVHFYSQRIFLEPWQFLAQVEQLEKVGARQAFDQSSLQTLSCNLAKLGRDDEVRRIDFPHLPRSAVAAEKLKLTVVRWKTAIGDIAANHRIVMIMEDHSVSKDREFVGTTLPAFKDAGFTHYAAEAISKFDTSLAERRYPTKVTGFYTSDPKFSNVLRRALDLDFTVLGGVVEQSLCFHA